MKKNLLFKTFSGIAALSAFGSLASLTTLTSCNHQAKITINNKITDLDWLDRPYQLDVAFDHQKDAQLLFSSSNQEVATIDDQGCIRGVGNGSTIIKAYSSLDEKVSDEFELNVSELWVSGTVTDQNNNPLADVNVSYDGTSIKTDADGSYRARLAKPGSVLYFDKTNYFGQAFKSTYALASAEHILNVKLTPYVEGVSATVTGTVRDVTGQLVPNCSVTFNPENPVLKRHVITDQYGVYRVHLDGINPDDPQVPYVTHNAKYDSLEDLTEPLDLTEDVVTQDITVYPFQYDVKAYVGKDHNNEKIIMHAYYKPGEAGLGYVQVNLESNFVKAFDDNNKFKLTVTNSDHISKPNKTGHGDYEFDITFASNGEVEVTGFDGPWPFSVEVQYNPEDKFHLSLLIYETIDFTMEGTIGLNLDSFGRGTFTPYEHAKYSTDPSNELSYVRLDLATNALYPSSDNYNIFEGLDWDTPAGDDWLISPDITETGALGFVASKYNFGYQVKIAKRVGTIYRDGIYILTKYAQDQMAHYMPDGYQPHFFIYTKQLTDGHYPAANDIGTWVKHIAPISGYWMQSFTVNGIESPFDNRQEYDQIFRNEGSLYDSPKVYAKEDLMITYIPYSFLGEGFDANRTFGFACNLQYQYTGGEWHAWQGTNPTGYVNIPHFEEATSYIQFNPNLSIIPYKP